LLQQQQKKKIVAAAVAEEEEDICSRAIRAAVALNPLLTAAAWIFLLNPP